MEHQPTSKKKIGIIERDKEIAEVLQMALEVDGHEVVQLEYAKLAEEQNFHRFIRRHRPPLVFLDVPYPFEQSWEVYERLVSSKGNSRRQFIPMGTFDQKFADRLRESGQPYLPKPFNLEELETLVRDHYPQRRTKPPRTPQVQPVFQNLLLPSYREPVFAIPDGGLRRGV